MDTDIVADVVFVIEGTAINGAYMHEIKSNYIVATLEYFSQGLIDDSEYLVSEQNSTLYGIVLYRTAQAWPDEIVKTYGPYTNPKKVLQAIERLDLTGGKSESNANLAEGLATALVCFDDLKDMRPAEGKAAAVPKHCIVICNSAPYSMPVLECMQYENKTVEQLASIIHEKNINLSIISPRKIPILFKLFMKADGDQPITAKNYSKDIRHLVLLKGYHLKERPLSPSAMPTQSSTLMEANCNPQGMSSQQPQLVNSNQNYNNMNQQRWHFQNQPPQQQRLPYMPTSQQNSALLTQLSAPPNQPGNPMAMRMQMLNQQQQMQQNSPNPQQAPVSSTDGGGPSGRDREKIWTGVLEWIDKSKPDQPKVAKQVPCHVTANIKDGEPEVKADNWPPKLLMQLMPKQLVANIGEQYLQDSKMVIFRPNPCEALESLSKVMNTGFAGCVHFTATVMPTCSIKVLILLYTAEKKTFIGFIPNNQTMFVDRLRKVIQQKQVQGNNVGSNMQQQQQHPPPNTSHIPQKPLLPMDNNLQDPQQQLNYNSYSQMPMSVDPMQQNMNMMQSQIMPQRMMLPQQNMHPNAQAMAQQQRMVRPIMNNSPGLRHLLQQQTPPTQQFRPTMAQMSNPSMGGGPNMGVPNRPNSYDDSNFDFM